jgi:hypothetical protein
MDELSIPALEIFLHVLENRLDEVELHIKPKTVTGSIMKPSDFLFHQICFVCCTKIGEQYEEMLSFRGAIPWYERAVLYAQRIVDSHTRATALSIGYCNRSDPET